jgi:hypothetical protein
MLEEHMIEKPKSLNEVLSEDRLCDWLNLPVTNSGRSRQLSHWIKGGLKYVEKSERRYFFEQDVINYLWKRYQRDDEPDSV